MTTPTANSSLGSRAEVPTDADVAAARQVSRQWGWVLVGGIAAVLVGIAILSVRWDVESLAAFTGVVFAIRGITDIATSGSRPHRGAAIFSGILGLIVAIVAFSWPGPTLFVLATLTGVWLVVGGILTAVGALFVRGPLWGLWLIAGFVAVPLGSWALAHPDATLAVIVAVVGLWAIIGGVMEIFASFELRRLPEAMEAMQRSASPAPTPAVASVGDETDRSNRSVGGNPAPSPAPAG